MPTGYALADALRRARDAAFDAHLTKPSRPEDVEAVLARGRQGLYGVGGAG